jgi:hypothetical protein
MISLSECQDRHIYRIGSRNLMIGVFRKATNGFIGIREKFGDLYLFEEYHWDCGAPYGTVNPIEVIGVLPDEIEVTERMPTIDSLTRRRVEFDRTPEPEHRSGMKGWYFLDSNEYSRDIRPMSQTYKPLFDYLMNMEKQLNLRGDEIKYEDDELV